MMRRTAPMALSTALLLTLAAAIPPGGPGAGSARAETAADERHPIQLVRPKQVEQEYDLVASATETIRNRMSGGGQAGTDETIRRGVELEAGVRITMVDDHGLPTQMVLRVRKLTVRMNDVERTPVEEGQTMVASREDGGTVFRVEGSGALPAEIGEVLASVVDLSPPPVSLDDVFGSDRPRRAGESWSIDAAAASRMFTQMQLNARSRDVEGEVRFPELAEHDGHRCVRLEADMDVSRLSFPPGALPPGMHVQEATVTQQIGGAYPLDKTLPPLRENALLAMSLHFEGRMGPDQPEVSIRTDASRQMKWQITPR